MVKSMSMNSETQICLPLLWALSLGLGSVFWTSEANFVTSLDVGVLFLDVGLMTLSLRTNLLLLTVLSLGREGVVRSPLSQRQCSSQTF